jgi:parvulin-like peptidyl-prolyl isomerase
MYKMINETYIKQELRKLTESQFDLRGYIEKRLKQYTQDNGSDFDDLRNYFSNNTDIVQPTNAQEEEEAYLKLLNDFLSSEGY